MSISGQPLFFLTKRWHLVNGYTWWENGSLSNLPNLRLQVSNYDWLGLMSNPTGEACLNTRIAEVGVAFQHYKFFFLNFSKTFLEKKC